ncbi:MAG: glycosyltransferase family A protein [Opitutaceae bacterium]|nr:glycosyltransferase family A protein [Opitutaceae bacterium]
MSLPPLDLPPVYGTRSTTPLLTIGVPSYHRPPLLRETLASLAALEGAPDCEVIVCDDGGRPETRQVIAEFPSDRFALFLNLPPLGAVANWNRCLQLARGRWVMILHEDDTLYPWYLRLVLPRLRDGVSAVCTRVVQGPTPPPLPPPAGTPAVRPYPPLLFLKSAFTPFPGVLFPRELGLRLGGFDPRWGPLADYEFWYRLAAAGRAEVVRATGAFYRVSEGQWTESQWPVMLRRMHLLRLAIARRHLPSRPRLGRWLARFFTYRSALAYTRRFPQKPAGLGRALALGRIPLRTLPSGWVWQALKLLA